MLRKNYWLLWFAIAIPSYAFISGCEFNRPYEEVERKIRSLSTKDDVIKTFGYPRYIETKGASNYFVTGYSFKDVVIEHEVYIYFPTVEKYEHIDVIAYIYFDANNFISDYFVGGS